MEEHDEPSYAYNIRQDDIPVETRLHSEVAALKYKNERLANELRECESRTKSKDHSLTHLTNEVDTLKENVARISAINNSLQRKLQEVEDRERSATLTNQRNESELSKLKRENQHYQEKIIDLESQLRSLLIDREASDQAKEQAQRNIIEFCRKIASAIDFHEDHSKSDSILKRIYELYQENSRLKMRVNSLQQSLESFENEGKLNADMINRLNSEKENVNHQIVTYLTTIDSLKREKDELQAEKSYLQTEVQSSRDKSVVADRTVISLNEQIKNLEQQIHTYKENALIAEDKSNRLEKDLRNFQESVAIQLSTGSRMVDATQIGIRERIKDIQLEIKDKQFSNDQLREKVGRMTESIERLEKLLSESKNRLDDATTDKALFSKRLQETETQLTTLEILNEGLRKDKNRYMQFLEQLGNIMGIDEVSKELGFDLQTDAIVARAEQLAKLEGDRLADKTATVYQLQRRLKTLKEQVEKKDLHLDMLRRKITLLEDSVKLRTTLELERDESLSRAKKFMKQVEKLELELKDAKISIKELKSQLADAAEYKIISLERARKIEELENRLNDLELLRVKYNRKVNLLKDQLKVCRENSNQERDLNDHAFQKLSSDLNSVKKSLVEANRRETQLLNLRNTVGKLLGIDWSKSVVPDYELIAKLEKTVQTNREFAQVSKKLSDDIKQMPSRGDHSPKDFETGSIDQEHEYM